MKDIEIKKLVAKQKRIDALFALIGLLALAIGIGTLAALMYDLLHEGLARINLDFFRQFPSRFAGRAGILSAWVGSCLVMLVCAVTAIPIGIGAAIYLEEYAPKNWLTDIIEINISNLAGVPSIVYGLMALGLFIYKFQFGHSILSAGLTLALLILPLIITASREAIRAVPQTMREASYAMGSTQWQTTRYHVLPYSLGGILTGIIIALSRAIGETAPLITIGALTFIAFLPHPPFISTFPYISFEWIRDPFTVMPIQMFNWVSRPQVEFQQNAAAAGLVLMSMTLLMNGVAIFIRFRFRKKIKW